MEIDRIYNVAMTDNRFIISKLNHNNQSLPHKII